MLDYLMKISFAVDPEYRRGRFLAGEDVEAKYELDCPASVVSVEHRKFILDRCSGLPEVFTLTVPSYVKRSNESEDVVWRARVTPNPYELDTLLAAWVSDFTKAEGEVKEQIAKRAGTIPS